MEFATIVFFGSILFVFLLLYLAIRFWKRKRRLSNQSTRQFSQSYGTTGGVLSSYDDNDSETEDYSDHSSFPIYSNGKEELIGAKAEMRSDLSASNNETTSDSSWSYNSTESSATSSDSSSWSSCSSSSGDSSSSCSSGSSCSSSSSSD